MRLKLYLTNLNSSLGFAAWIVQEPILSRQATNKRGALRLKWIQKFTCKII